MHLNHLNTYQLAYIPPPRWNFGAYQKSVPGPGPGQDKFLGLIQVQVEDLVQDPVQDLVRDQVDPEPRTTHFSMKFIEFDLKWVHMAWYEFILRLDRALWLTIISKPLPTPKMAMKD